MALYYYFGKLNILPFHVMSAHSSHVQLTRPATHMIIAPSSPPPPHCIITVSSPVSLDHVRPLLRYHDGGCVCVAGHNGGHDGRVNDSQPGNSIDLNINVKLDIQLRLGEIP